MKLIYQLDVDIMKRYPKTFVIRYTYFNGFPKREYKWVEAEE